MRIRLLHTLVAGMLLSGANDALSQEVTTFIIKGQVVLVEDPLNLLDNTIKVGDAVKGRIKFKQAAADENPDVTVGDYRYNEAPGGMWVKINRYLFKPDPSQRNFLAELVNRPPAQLGDAIVFRSYKNIFPMPFGDTHISWQLDDPTGAALSNVDLPQEINLSAWTQVFGLTIHGREDRGPREVNETMLIRAVVTKVLLPKNESVLKDGFEEAENVALPEAFALHQNFPNPFNPTTTIGYALPEEGFVSLRIYDLLGKEVRTLVDDFEFAGMKSVRWDGRDDMGREVSAGLYIYRLEAEGFAQARKLAFVK